MHHSPFVLDILSPPRHYIHFPYLSLSLYYTNQRDQVETSPVYREQMVEIIGEAGEGGVHTCGEGGPGCWEEPGVCDLQVV